MKIMHWTDMYGKHCTAQIKDNQAEACKQNWEAYFGKQINCWYE